jgi:hypothetical protein
MCLLLKIVDMEGDMFIFFILNHGHSTLGFLSPSMYVAGIIN